MTDMRLIIRCQPYWDSLFGQVRRPAKVYPNGRLQFGEDRADVFARDAGEFGCRCLPM